MRNLKKKILILNNSTRISGAEISLLSLLKLLDRNKYELFLGVPPGEISGALPDTDPISIVPVPLQRLTRKQKFPGLIGSFWNVLVTSIRLSLFVRRNAIDIVYANAAQAMVYCIILRMLTFKKIIWHVRDIPGNQLTAIILSWNATRIICVSQFISDQFRFGAPKKQVVYNGVDTCSWQPSTHPVNLLRTGLRLNNNVLLIGQIGQLIPWKNHLDMIDIAQQVIAVNGNVHFVIIGEDLFKEASHYTDHLKDQIRVRGLERYISFIGHHGNIKEYMDCLDIILHCADNEPFGRVILEGMALEKPIVARNSGGPREIIRDGETGFLADTTTDMARQLLLLVNDAETRTAFGRAGRRWVQSRFSIAEHTSRIESILDNLYNA